MRKTWVLVTETKGTGAQMVPLEKVLQKPAPKPRRPVPRVKPAPLAADAVAPKQPSRFRVVDALTRQVLADGAGIGPTVDLLEELRSPVDVSIYAWQPKTEEWRPLSHPEKMLLWGFRGRGRPVASKSERS